MSKAAAGGPSAAPAAVVLVAGAVLVLVAQFGLDGWADANQAAHWAQHALLFWAGLMVGGALLRLYQLGSRPT